MAAVLEPQRRDRQTAPCREIGVSDPDRNRLTRWLLVAVATLVALSTAGQVLKHVYGHTQLKGFVPAFYLDNESSVPTWYSSVGLLLAALLLAAIFVVRFLQGDRFRWHWGGLGVLFALLSIDEVAMFHEYPIDPLREALHADGLLYYTWVIPGAAFVGLIGLGFARFLLHLPARTRNGFLLAGVVFVGGAIGVEMLSGRQASRSGEENLSYALIITAEESCEMLGVVLFIHALTGYMASHGVDVRIGVSGEAAELNKV